MNILELSKKKDLPAIPKEIEGGFKEMETEFADAVKQNGQKAVAKGGGRVTQNDERDECQIIIGSLTFKWFVKSSG